MTSNRRKEPNNRRRGYIPDPWVVVIGNYHFGPFRGEENAEAFVKINGGKSWPLWGQFERDIRGRSVTILATRSVAGDQLEPSDYAGTGL